MTKFSIRILALMLLMSVGASAQQAPPDPERNVVWNVCIEQRRYFTLHDCCENQRRLERIPNWRVESVLSVNKTRGIVYPESIIEL